MLSRIVIDQFFPPDSMEDMWDISGLENVLAQDFAVKLPIKNWLETEEDLHEESLRQRIQEAVKQHLEEREQRYTSEVMYQVEKTVMLRTLDAHWKEHLAAMDHLRRSVSLRGYANKDPKQEYKREAFLLFSSMLDGFYQEACQALAKFKVSNAQDIEALEAQRREQSSVTDVKLEHASAPSAEEDEIAALPQKPIVKAQKIGRNDPCHCGSGKKYKICHGKI